MKTYLSLMVLLFFKVGFGQNGCFYRNNTNLVLDSLVHIYQKDTTITKYLYSSDGEMLSSKTDNIQTIYKPIIGGTVSEKFSDSTKYTVYRYTSNHIHLDSIHVFRNDTLLNRQYYRSGANYEVYEINYNYGKIRKNIDSMLTVPNGVDLYSYSDSTNSLLLTDTCRVISNYCECTVIKYGETYHRYWVKNLKMDSIYYDENIVYKELYFYKSFSTNILKLPRPINYNLDIGNYDILGRELIFLNSKSKKYVNIKTINKGNRSLTTK